MKKDRSVCDYIETLEGWGVSPINTSGLKVIITNSMIGTFSLYLTYNEERPSNEKIKELHKNLTDENSVVQKAHKRNMTVEQYLSTLEK